MFSVLCHAKSRWRERFSHSLYLCLCSFVFVSLWLFVSLSISLSVSLSPWLCIFVSLALSQADNRPFFLCNLNVTNLQFQNYQPLIFCLPTISLQNPFYQRKNDDLGWGSSHLHTFAMHTETRLKIWHTDTVLCVCCCSVLHCVAVHVQTRWSQGSVTAFRCQAKMV